MPKILSIISYGINVLFFIALVLLGAWTVNSGTLLNEYKKKNIQLKKEQETMEIFASSKAYSDKLYGKFFVPIDRTGSKSVVRYDGGTSRKLRLILLFEPHNCQPCLLTQFKFLNRIHSRLSASSEVKIEGISLEESPLLARYKAALELSYPLKVMNKDSVPAELTVKTPAVFVLDDQNQILRAHIAVIGRPEFSLLFYNEVCPLLGIDKPEFGISGLRYIDIIKRDLPEVVQELLY